MSIINDSFFNVVRTRLPNWLSAGEVMPLIAFRTYFPWSLVGLGFADVDYRVGTTAIFIFLGLSKALPWTNDELTETKSGEQQFLYYLSFQVILLTSFREITDSR